MDTDLRQKFQCVRMLALDVDGVLTDGGVYVLDTGQQFRRFDIKDGLGLHRLHDAGVMVVIISSARCEAAVHRCQQLGIREIFFQVKDKLSVLSQVCDAHFITLGEVCYVGDDIVDQPIFSVVGVSCATADAVIAIRSRASYVTELAGGHGAVREVCDLILETRG